MDPLCSGEIDLDGLRLRGGVDQFEDEVVGLRVVGDGVEEAGVDGVEFGLEDLIAEVGREHGLRVVAGGAVAGEGVVADEVAGPLHAAGVDVDEERSVGGEDDDVAVALHAGHPCGVAEGCAEVGGGRAFAGGPLAYQDLRAVAVGGVVVVDVVEELLGGAVVVVVDDVGRDAFDGRGGDELQVRVLRLDGLVELGVAAVVAAGAVEPVFVADLDVGEMEGRGVAVFGALGSPLCGGVAGDVLDLVERVLNVGLEVGAGVDVLLRRE